MIAQLMSILQKNNPKMYQMYQQARQTNSNPADLFKQITKNYSPEQEEQLFNAAKQYGIPEEVIQQVRY